MAVMKFLLSIALLLLSYPLSLYASAHQQANDPRLSEEPQLVPKEWWGIETTIQQIELDGPKIKTWDEWTSFKAKFISGDHIHRFAAPPLSGPVGLILVRNDVVIARLIFYKQ